MDRREEEEAKLLSDAPAAEDNARLPCALAVDPGRAKCGMAVARQDGHVLYRGIVSLEDLTRVVTELIALHRPIIILCGNGTGSRPVLHSLRTANLALPIQAVDEAHTSEVARLRFVRENKPPLAQRLLPYALRTPWLPYDDYVAVLLVERYWSPLASA